ncbi:MAG: hypothetical protein AAFV95_04910 [Bacteroidota bacterium]
MIKIKRSPAPDGLSKANVLRETALAKELFVPSRDGEDGIEEARKAVKFDKYGAAGVKEALIEMCNSKCAYCESVFLHVYYGDIEHFRPKKEIKFQLGEELIKIKPGYYWLANDWNNLLLSCLFCNQAKKQKVRRRGDDGEWQIDKITIGKQNKFPLLDLDLFRADRDHRDWDNGGREEDEENRLIIDPCVDEPEAFFTYTTEGVIRPKPADGKEKLMAENSIRVFALQRLYLVQEREKKLIEILAQINRIRQAVEELNKIIDDNFPVVTTFYQERIEKEVRKLLGYTRKEEAYAGMARQYAYEFLRGEMQMTQEQLDQLIEEVHHPSPED